MNTITHNLINSYLNSENKIEYFKNLTNNHKILLLPTLEKKEIKKITNNLNNDEIVEILKFLDPDEITDIIQNLNKRKQKKIISNLTKNHKEKVNYLLKFTPDSAGGLMNLNYIIITDKTPKKQILEKLKKHLKTGKKEPSILVVDQETNDFLGELRISQLIFEHSNEIYSNLKKLPIIIYNEDQEEVLNIFRKNIHEKIVVIDEDNSIIGIIHAKNIFRVMEEEYTEDFYGITGLDKQEDITDNAISKVKFRLGWLIINLGTAFLAAWTITFFEDTISKFVLLAAFMPIIAGMGGNAGTQTTAILIRSLALKKIDSKIIKKILLSEIFAAIINGIIIGIIIATIAYIFNSNLTFGIIAGIAVVANLIVAAISGIIIPLIIKSLKLDPASASTVFVTTATDVLGFFIFLSLAKMFLI